MTRVRKPRVAMSAQSLPLQRLYLIKSLPALPRGWLVEQVRPSTPGMPARLPAGSRYLGQVEWSWSPMHMRISAYYLSQSSDRRRWVLWWKSFDDNYGCWAPAEPILAAPRGDGFQALAAAQLLLLEAWGADRDEGTDRFHWIAEEGDLDVADLQAVADAVWEEWEPDGAEDPIEAGEDLDRSVVPVGSLPAVP